MAKHDLVSLPVAKHSLVWLKVHKHDIILNLFYLNKILVKFSKKIAFFRFSPEFQSSNIFAVTEHMRNQIFLERYPKKISPKMFICVLLDGFLNGFSKFGFFIVEICNLVWDFWVIFENYSMRMLSIRWNDLSHTEHTRKDFIAYWAYSERISAKVGQLISKNTIAQRWKLKFVLHFCVVTR